MQEPLQMPPRPARMHNAIATGPNAAKPESAAAPAGQVKPQSPAEKPVEQTAASKLQEVPKAQNQQSGAASTEAKTGPRAIPADPIPAGSLQTGEAEAAPRKIDHAPTPASLVTPLLLVTAVAALLAANWTFSSRNEALASLEQTKAQLSALTDSKASVDRALADAQGRLAAAEKAVADVKAALAPLPPVAPAKKPATASAAPPAAAPASAAPAPAARPQ